MALTIQSFRSTVTRPLIRTSTQSHSAKSFGRRRCFQTIPSHWAGDTGKEPGLETLSSEGLDSDAPATDPEKAFEEILKEHGRIRQNLPATLRNLPTFREVRPRKPKLGALNMGLDPSENPEEDPEFEEDDITSLAHGQLEQHREYRHYARLAAWEMPLLTKMAKEFVPPTQMEILRFRYTNYMGEQHPAEKKVIVEFCPADILDLTDVQRDKLKKLASSRWNPETDIIKMSCEMFETQAQNKRYLGDLVDTLLQEARDPTDTFEDIPLDTRHHKIKTKPKFPVEWRMTDARRAELEAARRRAELMDEQRAKRGTIVDGVQRIEASLSIPKLKESALEAPIMTAGKGGGKGKKLRQRG